jgi:hypothetical protein
MFVCCHQSAPSKAANPGSPYYKHLFEVPGKDNVRESGRCRYMLGSGLGIPGERVSSCVKPIELERSILVPRRRIASSESSEAQLPFEECDVDVFGVMKQSTSGKCRLASTGLEMLSACRYESTPRYAQGKREDSEVEDYINILLRYASQCLVSDCVWCHIWRVSYEIMGIVTVFKHPALILSAWTSPHLSSKITSAGPQPASGGRSLHLAGETSPHRADLRIWLDPHDHL